MDTRSPEVEPDAHDRREQEAQIAAEGGFCCGFAAMHMGHDEDCPEMDNTETPQCH